LLIIAVGLLGVFYRLDVTPPAIYPWSDESDVASDAVASVREGLQFHYPAQLAGGPVSVWLEAGWIMLFGKSLTGLRVLNGLVNVTSVLLLYLLVRQLPFADQVKWPFSGPSFNHWLGLTAALLFAGSTWILGLARIATPNWSLVPPATTFTFYFLWLALKTNRRRYFVATGVMMGWAIYNYIPAYFVPVVPAIFLGLMWRSKTQKLPYPPSRLYLLPFPVAFIVALPILTFFALHPVAVMQRVVQLAHTNQIADARLMAVGVIDTFSSFGIFPNWILQGRFEHVAFDPFLALLFVIGLVIAFRRRHDPVYLFLLIWWVVMILPAFLSRSASLGFIFEMWRRGIGAQPVSFVFPALTVMTTAQWLSKQLTNQPVHMRLAVVRSAILPALIAVAVVVSTGLSYWLYFERWANSGVVPLFFAAGPVRLVEWMEAESDGDTLFIFPRRPNVSPTTRPELFTVRYLFEGEAATAYPLVDETTLDLEMAGLLDRYQPAVVQLMLHDRLNVDPKDYFEDTLGWRGEVISRGKQPDYNIITYRLYDQPPSDTSVETRKGVWFRSVSVDFGQSLRLVGQRLQPETLMAGRTLGVALRWAKVAKEPARSDYNVSLALYNAQDDEITRADKPLLSPADYLTTRHWLPGDESTMYYLLPVPSDVPPGRYTLRAVAYNPETGERLPPVNGRTELSFTLAEMPLWSNPVPIDPATLAIAQPIGEQVIDGLALVGAESSGKARQHPGDQWRITMLWQTTRALSQDVGLTLDLVRANGESTSLLEEIQPLVVNYPTSTWPAGSVYRINYPVLLPATVAGGDYMAVLRLHNLQTAEVLGEQSLLPVSIERREHIFEAPALANQANIDFGEVIRLRGFEFSGNSAALVSGQEMQLKLQWQALREMPESYKIFLHLTDAAGQIIDQVDTLPQQGAVPTTGWVSGEIVEDELTLVVSPEMPPDAYRLVAGLYNEVTGERLMTGQSDHIVLVEGTEIRSGP
jgi:hypothetical protein